HGAETVGPYVGLGGDEDVGRSLALDHELVDEADERRAGPRRGLAVGEGPGAALAEQGVALRVVSGAVVPGREVADPLLDALAPLEDEGRIALARQQVSGEEPSRPAAHDDRGSAERLATVGDPADDLAVLAL